MSWILYALLSAVFAALVAIFGKIGLKNIDSTLATTLRSMVMAGFLIIISLALGKFSFLQSINSKALTFIILSGVAGALSWLAYFFAIKVGPVSGVVALDRMSLVFALVLAALFLSESVTLPKVAGAVLVTIGAILIAR